MTRGKTKRGDNLSKALVALRNFLSAHASRGANKDDWLQQVRGQVRRGKNQKTSNSVSPTNDVVYNSAWHSLIILTDFGLDRFRMSSKTISCQESGSPSASCCLLDRAAGSDAVQLILAWRCDVQCFDALALTGRDWLRTLSPLRHNEANGATQ